MPMTVAQKLIQAHLLEGEMVAGKEINLKIDQTLCQDATGTMVMLELEAMGLQRAKTKCSVQIEVLIDGCLINWLKKH